LIALTACLLPGGAFPAAGEEEDAPKPAEKPATTTTPAKAPLPKEVVQAMKEGVEAMRRGDWKQAAAAWEKTVKLDPANAGAWANLGKVQFQQQKAEAAITSLEKAVSLQPALADAWTALGLAYESTKAPMRAVSCLTRAVHENPADARARNSLAIVLKHVGWTGAAESELQKALDLDPRYSEAHFNLAVMYLERRPPSLEMARRHYEAARQLGAEPDKELEAQLAGKEPAPVETPEAPAQKLPSSEKSQPKSTRPK
jgi:Flp pilus assembly protein TadD